MNEPSFGEENAHDLHPAATAAAGRDAFLDEVSERLDAAEAAGERERLRVLEELYETLERELENEAPTP